jgi:hypothetical protein
MMTKELRTKIAYTIAWLLYTLGVKSIAKLPETKKLYAKAMAARWCDKEDRKFCELAFYKLYNYDIAKYLRQNEVPLILSLALYDVERGDHLLTTVRAYVEKGVLPTELGILTGKIDIERIIPTVAGILKAVGDVTPELLAAIWQIIASRSKTLPPLQTIRDNVILNTVLSEMERRGYVVKDGERYKLTDKGRTIAADVWIPLEVERLKSFKYVTPAFYVVLNASNGLV